jgi:hypothetical protein
MRWIHGATILATIAVAACSVDEPPTAFAPVADTTAASLWSHLQAANYQSWRMWPGKTARYTGTEPHGMLLTTYVNDRAYNALTSGAATMPAGAVIVKENYMLNGSYDAATVMHRVPGYDLQNGDWFWAKYDANGVAAVAGRVAMCSGCHAAARQRDFLMTPLPQN